MDGKNKRGRPKRRWTDDLMDWCNKDIWTLHGLAMDRRNWSHFVKYVMDSDKHCGNAMSVKDFDNFFRRSR